MTIMAWRVYHHPENLLFQDGGQPKSAENSSARRTAGRWCHSWKIDMVENKLPFFHDAASAVVRS